MKRLLLACAVSMAAASAGAMDLPTHTPGIGSGRPLVIEESPGGDTLAFRLKALDLAAHHVPVIVDGMCFSSCTLLVDIDRANVCITTSAVFGYHQQSWADGDGDDRKDAVAAPTTKPAAVRHYSKLSYETPGLEAYLESRGGPPANTNDILVLSFNELKQFYRPCAGAQ